MPIVQHRARRLSNSSNTDDLHAEIETLQAQLDTTQSNLVTLRGTNNRLNDRIQKLEGQLDDGAVHVQTQERDINSLRRQLRISSAEITRLRTEKEVLERDYEGVHKDIGHERDEQRKLMEKVAELEEQVASALHLHVVSSTRETGGTDANGEGGQKQVTSWLDLKAKLRETENELDAVMQERDWLEGQLEKFIHAKDALDSNFSIKNLRTRTSMSSLAGESIRSFGAESQSSRRSSASSHAPVVRQSLGEELGLEWNGEYDSDAESDSTERADNDSEADVPDAGLSLSVPKITRSDDAVSVASSSRRDLKDFAMRLDTSGRDYRSRSRAPSFTSSHRAPSVAASIRSRMSTRSLRPGSRFQDLDDIPPAPVTATAVFHEIERQHDAKVARLQNDIVTLSTDLQGEIELLQEEVNLAREERDVCVLEIQRLSTELNVANARHDDSIKALEATLAATAIKEQAKPEPPVVDVQPLKEVKEIGIQTDDFELPATEIAPQPIIETTRELEPEPERIVRDAPGPSVAFSEPFRAPAQAPIIAPFTVSIPAEEPAPSLHAALEAEFSALREQEQTRLAENLKLKSDIDVLRRDLREKDTLLRAEVVRLERDLDELIRDNRNMKDDAEINHYKVENLADELDRTRELLQIQAGERREFMEEIEQLRGRNRELELQLRIRRATPSPIPTSSFHDDSGPRSKPHFDDLAPFIFSLKDSSSAKSDFEDMLDRSDDEFALASDSESDSPPPSPVRIKQKRRKSSSAKHKHHSKKEKKKEKEKEKEREVLDEVETPKESKSRRHSRIASVSKIPTASKIPSAPKVNKKSMTLPRSVSAQLPATLRSPRSPSPPGTPYQEPQFEMDDVEADNLMKGTPVRTRSSTLPIKIPRPSFGFRAPVLPTLHASPAAPAEPQPDKTYWKDLMVGGYALQPHEYNKHRRDMRLHNKNMQIKVTAKGIETKGRVGTGAGFGVGNYAEQAELKPAPKKKFPRRRTSFSDDEAYTHRERSGWLSGMFRKQG